MVLFHVEPFFFMIFGLVLGFVIGALPGFDSANGCAILLPFSIGLSMESALILMATVFVGTQVAGAIPGILLNIPGTAGAAATALDGYPMAQQGKANLAIGIVRAASAIGGLIGGVIVIFLIGPFSKFALTFQSPETFLMALFGLLIIGSIGGDWLKGFLSGFMGVLIAMMSASVETAVPRMTFGFPELYGNVPFVPAVVGLFGIAQMLDFLSNPYQDLSGLTPKDDTKRHRWTDHIRNFYKILAQDTKEAIDGVKIALGSPFNILRSSFIGLTVGIVPGVGTSVANFVSYAEARRSSKDPESFGKGNPDGIIACEACDNASVAGTLVPTFTLGIPGSSTAAILLAALYLHGVQPGPQVMVYNSAEVYSVLWAIIISGVLIMPIGIILAVPLVWMVRAPQRYLIPGVFLICAIGAYALRNTYFDVALMIIFGVIGIMMRLGGYPIVPLVIGLILGPIAEENFMRSLALSQNNPLIFTQSMTSCVLLALIGLIMFWNIRNMIKSRSVSVNVGDESQEEL